MARIVNRELSTDLLADVFARLDRGGTRGDVRSIIRNAQGRGIGNNAIAEIRRVHRAVRRSEGYNLGERGSRRIRTTGGDLIRPAMLPADRYIPYSRRPNPPIIDGMRQTVTAVFSARRNGVDTGRLRVETFNVESAEQLNDALRQAATQRGRGTEFRDDAALKSPDPTADNPEILQLRSPLAASQTDRF